MTEWAAEIAALAKNDGRRFAGVITETKCLEATNFHITHQSWLLRTQLIMTALSKFLLFTIIPLFYWSDVTYYSTIYLAFCFYHFIIPLKIILIYLASLFFVAHLLLHTSDSTRVLQQCNHELDKY